MIKNHWRFDFNYISQNRLQGKTAQARPQPTARWEHSKISCIHTLTHACACTHTRTHGPLQIWPGTTFPREPPTLLASSPWPASLMWHEARAPRLWEAIGDGWTTEESSLLRIWNQTWDQIMATSLTLGNLVHLSLKGLWKITLKIKGESVINFLTRNRYKTRCIFRQRNLALELRSSPLFYSSLCPQSLAGLLAHTKCSTYLQDWKDRLGLSIFPLITPL